MKFLTILEAGGLVGIVIFFVGIMVLGALFVSIIVSFVVKLIYERKGDKNSAENNLYRPL